MSRARVLLADDHVLVAEALKILLAEEFDLVGAVTDGHEMVKAAMALRPDVVVADITMPRLNGVEALAQLRHALPDVRVVFLTMHHDVAYARRALEAGALGYVLKHSAPAELILAVKAALQGRTFITPALAGEVLDAIKREGAGARDPVAALTARQREILQLIAEGHGTKEVAFRLGVSIKTVESHRAQIMKRLDIRDVPGLVRYAIRSGLVSPDR